ncbi:tetratricopeptide repeat protein [Bacteroidales bacterium AH-315-I05]|nr:tetratricopeptide repeat protein [Bacteroidales bacterium AH-315-I05]
MKFKIVTIAFVLISTASFSQKKYNWGETPEDSVCCAENYSLYSEYYKQKNYDDAIKFWRKSIKCCPKLSKSQYVHGSKMYKQFIKKEEDADKKLVLLDTLLWVYDKRIEHFGQKCYVLGRKGSDMLKYSKKEPEKAFEVLKVSVDECGNKSEAGVIVSLYKARYLMYKKEKDAAKKQEMKAQLLEWYPKLAAICKHNIATAKKDNVKEMYQKVQGNLDAMFGPIADCPDIINVFGPKFEANPQDTNLLEMITKLMEKKECTSEELYLKSATVLVELKPSADAYYSVGYVAAQNNKCAEAIEHFKKSAEIAEDDKLKVKANMKTSKCYLKLGQYTSARTFAQKVLAISPNIGQAYIVIAMAYAASAEQCGDNDCIKKAAYWVAVDKLQKAKAVDETIAEKANQKIATYSKHFPGKEKCFFHNITEGTTYTVGCWINESTTVRFNE